MVRARESSRTTQGGAVSPTASGRTHQDALRCWRLGSRMSARRLTFELSRLRALAKPAVAGWLQRRVTRHRLGSRYCSSVRRSMPTTLRLVFFPRLKGLTVVAEMSAANWTLCGAIAERVLARLPVLVNDVRFAARRLHFAKRRQCIGTLPPSLVRTSTHRIRLRRCMCFSKRDFSAWRSSSRSCAFMVPARLGSVADLQCAHDA